MNVGTVRKTVRIGGETAGCGRSVLEVNHLVLLLLQDEKSEGSTLGIRRTETAGRSGIHAAYEPAFARFFQSSDVLVLAVYENGFVKTDGIADGLDVAFGHEPFLHFGIHRLHTVEPGTFTTGQKADEITVTAVDNGRKRISLSIERYALIAFHAQSVGRTAIFVAFVALDERSLSVTVLVIAQNGPEMPVLLLRLQERKPFLDFLPLEFTGFLTVGIGIVKRVLIVQQFFLYMDNGRAGRFFPDCCIRGIESGHRIGIGHSCTVVRSVGIIDTGLCTGRTEGKKD